MATLKKKANKWQILLRNFPETELHDLIVDAHELNKDLVRHTRYLNMGSVSQELTSSIYEQLNILLSNLMRSLEEFYGEGEVTTEKTPLSEVKDDIRNMLMLPNQSKQDSGSDTYISTQQLATAMKVNDTATMHLQNSKIRTVLNIFFFEPAWDAVLEKRSEMHETYLEKVLNTRGITKEEEKKGGDLLL